MGIKYKWLYPINNENFLMQLEEYNISKNIAKILDSRGIHEISEVKKFFSDDYEEGYDPFLMHDMKRAVDRINDAIENEEKISSDGEKKVVRIGLPGISNTILEAGGVAIGNKYFEEELSKEGYKVEYIYFQQAGPALNEAFAANKIDIAMYGDLPITVLKSRGINIKVFAVDNLRLQFGVIAQNNSGIKDIKNLEGKKVIYGKGTVQNRFFVNVLEAYHLDKNKFKMINAVGSEALSVFSSKQADALFGFYYNVLFMESKGLGKVIYSTIEKPEISSQSLVVGRNEYLEKNERVPVAIIKALKRAKEFTAKNPEKAFEIYARSGIPADIFKKAYSEDFTFENFNPEIKKETENKITSLIDFLYSNNFIKSKIKADELLTKKYYKIAMSEENKTK